MLDSDVPDDMIESEHLSDLRYAQKGAPGTHANAAENYFSRGAENKLSTQNPPSGNERFDLRKRVNDDDFDNV